MKSAQKWRRMVDGRIAVFRASVAAEGARKEMGEYLIGMDGLFTTSDEKSSYHLRISDLSALNEAVVSRVRENPDFPRRHVEDSLNGIEDHLRVTERAGRIPAGETPGVDRLKERFENYYRVYKRYFTFVIPRATIEPVLTENIVESLAQKVGEERARDCFSRLAKSPKPSEAEREEMDLMKLAAWILENRLRDYVLLSEDGTTRLSFGAEGREIARRELGG
jgi:hypothetical protein